jgi:hypothetical protein
MNSALWVIASCSPLNVNRRFGRKRRLHFQGRGISEAKKKAIMALVASSRLFLTSYGFLACIILPPWRWIRFLRKVG